MAIDLSVAPYYDDFNEDKGFNRLLFRPGRAVQARELTQLQTMLQNQIARFGQNIFLEGSVVIPGGVTIDTNYEYVKIVAPVSPDSITDIQIGAKITGQTNGVQAILMQSVAAAGSDPDTLYVRYVDGGSSGAGRFADGETITFDNPSVANGGNGDTGSFTVDTNGTGTGTKVNLDKGIYFIKGFFVAAVTQSLIVEKYGVPTGEIEIGLVSSEEIIESDDDASLLSNAQGTNNYNAPGADRYKLALALTKKADAGVGDDYFTIATIVDTEIVEVLSRTQYSILGDEFARRTYDESGHYTVDPFILRVEDSGTPTTLNFILDPGKAYVKGYEIVKSRSTTLEHDRAVTPKTDTGSQTPTVLGNYARAKFVLTTEVGVPIISEMEKVNLVNASAATIGTARVRAVEEEGSSIYRFYLFDVQFTSGGFNQVVTIEGIGTPNWKATIVDASNNVVNPTAVTNPTYAALFNTAQNTLLFPLSRQRVKGLASVNARLQVIEDGSTDTSSPLNNVTTSESVPAPAGSVWVDSSNWILVNVTDDTLETGVTYSGIGSNSVVISGLTTGKNYRLIGYVDKANCQARTKTVSTSTAITATSPGSADISLGQHDIFVIESVIEVTSSVDITDRYILDNGQRDNYYGIGKIRLKPSATPPTGNVTVNFKYFVHGSSGDFFSVDSYRDNASVKFTAGTGDYNYEDIPTYTTSNGTKTFLADVLDFRPVIDDDELDYTTAGAIVHSLPKVNDTITADVTYFLPRIDVLYLDSKGTFDFAVGISSLNPTAPTIPSNAMGIYTIAFNAGTLNKNDLQLNFIENRRYTMRDIGALENRLTAVEECCRLNKLEIEALSTEIVDDTTLEPRIPSGILTDNFSDHNNFDDVNDPGGAIDHQQGVLRAPFLEQNIRMIYTTGTNVQLKGDYLFPIYTEVDEISQPFASSSENINPYDVSTVVPTMVISPNSDESRDTNTPAAIFLPAEEEILSPVQNANWNNWQWNWDGIHITGIGGPGSV